MEQQTHATSSKQVGKTVEASQKTSTMVHEANYDEIHTSKTDQFVTYANRMESVSAALGNKDQVRG